MNKPYEFNLPSEKKPALYVT